MEVLKSENETNELNRKSIEIEYRLGRKNIGRTVQRLRLLDGLTQQQLADKSGVSRKMISDIENKDKDFNYTKVLSVLVSLNALNRMSELDRCEEVYKAPYLKRYEDQHTKLVKGDSIDITYTFNIEDVIKSRPRNIGGVSRDNSGIGFQNIFPVIPVDIINSDEQVIKDHLKTFVFSYIDQDIRESILKDIDEKVDVRELVDYVSFIVEKSGSLMDEEGDSQGSASRAPKRKEQEEYQDQEQEEDDGMSM